MLGNPLSCRATPSYCCCLRLFASFFFDGKKSVDVWFRFEIGLSTGSYSALNKTFFFQRHSCVGDVSWLKFAGSAGSIHPKFDAFRESSSPHRGLDLMLINEMGIYGNDINLLAHRHCCLQKTLNVFEGFLRGNFFLMNWLTASSTHQCAFHG